LESDRQRAREYITQTLESYGWSTELQPFEQGTNVIATQPGNDPEVGILVVGAHYDTVPESPGQMTTLPESRCCWN
ncbi:MAG: hypothetical protein HC925_07585, partial [Coleofasciculaceae cyanobacterium SM2_3_26]|nr:hypothetical protein [Coleofasciculaceae cyanobacterium SM2_3_26]